MVCHARYTISVTRWLAPLVAGMSLCGPMVLPVSLGGQQDTIRFSSTQQLTVDQLTHDFDVLRSALEEGHAGLYTHISKEEIDELFDATRAAITPMTEFEFLQHLSPLLAAIRDGHTRIRGSLGLTAYLDMRRIRLPFKLRFLAGKAYMHRNYLDDPEFEMGNEILSINGVPMDQITARMFRLMRADGRGETYKYKTLEGTSNFGIYYSLTFGLTERFDIRYLTRGGEERTMTVDGLTTPEVTQRFQTRYPNAGFGGDPVVLTYEGNIAVLKIVTFSFDVYQRAGIRFDRLLQDIFAALRDNGVTDLVIDVRDNSAGSDEFPKLLAAHLMSDNFEYYRSLELNSREFGFFEYTNVRQDDIPAPSTD